jgi:hypothetical protein
LPERLATMGEIHTGLLHNSVAVTGDLATRLLDPGVGERVRRSERPIARALSPDQLTGVDCTLSTVSGARARGIGTTASRTTLTGGHLLQGSARVTVVPARVTRRLPWSHYLSRPGVVESLHRAAPGPLASGFLAGPGDGELDLGAVASRAMDQVQQRGELDHRAAFRSVRTRLRWAVEPEQRRTVRFAVLDAGTRTLRLPPTDAPLPAVVAVCEDLARHDWLLTTLLAMVDRSGIGSASRTAVVDRLRPAIDFLLHLWMPGTGNDELSTQVWQALERHPGPSRQWQVNVDRVRDQLALAALDKLSARPNGDSGSDEW